MWLRMLIVIVTVLQTIINAMIMEHKEEIGEDKTTKDALNMLNLASKSLQEKYKFAIPNERRRYLAEIIMVFLFLSNNLQDKVSEYITYLTNKKNETGTL